MEFDTYFISLRNVQDQQRANELYTETNKASVLVLCSKTIQFEHNVDEKRFNNGLKAEGYCTHCVFRPITAGRSICFNDRALKFSHKKTESTWHDWHGISCIYDTLRQEDLWPFLSRTSIPGCMVDVAKFWVSLDEDSVASLSSCKRDMNASTALFPTYSN